MAIGVSSGVNLSSTFYLRKYYKNDQSASKASSRKEFKLSKLSNEDAQALRRAAKALGKLDYNEDEIESKILGSVDAFAKTYNNTLESCNKGDSNMQRYAKRLKDLSKKYGEKLDDIGITINNDGTLKVNENLLKKSDVSKLKEVFGKESSYAKQFSTIAKQIANTSADAMYAEMTGSGQNVDLTL